MTLVVFSCSPKEEEPKKEEMETGLPAGHPPMTGMDALGELSEDAAPDFDPSNPVLELSNISLTAPDSWEREKPTSSMRIVQYKLKSDPASKIVGFFFGQQDLIRENIDRWKAEFEELKDSKEEKLVNDKITMVTLEGVYNVKPFPMAQEFTPTPDYMVLAAIVPSSEGPYYFKVYAPSKILKNEIGNFKKFLNSYKVKA
ncbi:hypothetical protein MASR1M45_31260 [Candidatus Kapaibacterium sp.]